MRVAFLDPAALKPYTGETLRMTGLGGTEATVVRIAEALVRKGWSVEVSQAARDEVETVSGVEYTPFHTIDGLKVIVREPLALKDYPDAMLWLHDHAWEGVECRIWKEQDIIKDVNPLLIGVSGFHEQAILSILPWARVTFIYNPIDDELQPDDTPVDVKKLFFPSAPCKGLDKTLQAFEALEKVDSTFRLLVANPGYFRAEAGLFYKRKRVHYIGSIPHHQVIRHMRSSLCVFAINNVFPETFGLVYAEANAVGTPCLGLDWGAVGEVIGTDQLLPPDVRSTEIVDRVMEWKRSRPDVRLKDDFRCSRIVERWEHLLGDNANRGYQA